MIEIVTLIVRWIVTVGVVVMMVVVAVVIVVVEMVVFQWVWERARNRRNDWKRKRM